jgi:uncharacterized protein YdaU (DUF1376 family)
MSQKTDIWMPLYIGDYLADTAHLTTEQSGAYLHLLMAYWRTGALPNDDRALAQICRLPLDAWSIAQAMLRPFFSLGEDGLLHQKRSDAELERWNAKKLSAKEKAAKAAGARWKNDAPSNAPSINPDASSMAQAMLEPCPSPSPSPSPITSSSKEKVVTNTDSSKAALSDDHQPGSLFEESELATNGSGGPLAPVTTSNSKKPSAARDQARADACKRVFDHYIVKCERSPSLAYTETRRKLLLKRLDEVLRKTNPRGDLAKAEALMKLSVDGVAGSDWHMGTNPETGGKTYCELEKHVFKTFEQMEKWYNQELSYRPHDS